MTSLQASVFAASAAAAAAAANSLAIKQVRELFHLTHTHHVAIGSNLNGASRPSVVCVCVGIRASI